MKILFFLIPFLVKVAVPVFGQITERPEGIVIPVATLGDVSETRRQILQNTLIESLSVFYRLVPQDKFEEVQEKVFQEMNYEECTEDQCIIMIQEALQIENFFVLQVIGEGKDTQLSLKWVGLDDKKVKTDYCENCDTKELNKRIEGLVSNLESTISITNNSVKQNDEEDLRKKREEELRKKREEELRKKREEELRKKREEEKREKKSKRFTFRSFFVVNAIDLKIDDEYGVGFLNVTQSITAIEEREIKENSNFNSIYGIYNLNNCYFCDSFNITGVIGTGQLNYETKDGSLYKYNVNSYLILLGYQWYYDSGFSMTLLGGPILRDYSFIGSDLNSPNSEDANEIDSFVKKQKSGFYPAFLLGYSF